MRIRRKTLTHLYPFPVLLEMNIILISHAHRRYLKNDSSKRYAKIFWSYRHSAYNFKISEKKMAFRKTYPIMWKIILDNKKVFWKPWIINRFILLAQLTSGLGIARAGRPRGRSSSPGGENIFLFSMSSRLDLGPIQPPIQWLPRALSREVKLLQRVKPNTHLQLVPRSRICGSIHPLHHTPS
jgi:hypothetical protein